MTSFIQLTLLTIGKTFVIFGLNLTETSSAHLEIQGQSISLLLEPKHCGAQLKCPEGSQCVKGFCFWERCLLSKKSKGISFRLCPCFNELFKDLQLYTIVILIVSNIAGKAQLGPWENVGDCIGIGHDPTCGPGKQNQTRTCKDGTEDKCSDLVLKRTAPCHWADTILPNCKRKLLRTITYP